MNRSAGTGLIGFGIVMVVIGAILKYAVSVKTTGFNLNTTGIILLIVGIVAVVIGLLAVVMGGRSRTTIREDVHSTPTGQERVQQREDSTP